MYFLRTDHGFQLSDFCIQLVDLVLLLAGDLLDLAVALLHHTHLGGQTNFLDFSGYPAGSGYSKNRISVFLNT